MSYIISLQGTKDNIEDTIHPGDNAFSNNEGDGGTFDFNFNSTFEDSFREPTTQDASYAGDDENTPDKHFTEPVDVGVEDTSEKKRTKVRYLEGFISNCDLKFLNATDKLKQKVVYTFQG